MGAAAGPAADPVQEALRAQVRESKQRLGVLEEELAGVVGELEGLAAERQRFELVERVCDSLDKLGELGSLELFWGQRVEPEKAADHVRGVRKRIAGFGQRLVEIEDRRRDVLERLEQGRETVEDLQYELYQAVEAEKSRQAEWIVEREESPVPERRLVMPWMRGGEEDWRFRKTLAAALSIGLLFSFLLPLVDLPVPERGEMVEVPERLARLIRQAQEVPTPPAVVREEPPPQPDEPEPEPEPVVAEEVPVPETPQPTEPTPTVAQQPETPREAVQSTGILAFRESFSNLAQNRPAAQLGAQASISSAGEAAVGRTERSMVTSQEPGSSGGINLSSLSRDAGGGGGGQIDGVEVTRVESSIGTAGPSDRPLSAGLSAGRTDEEIQIVFDRYKAALYRLYNLELRRDPTLRGQMVLRITIEPDGSVSLSELSSTNMNAPELVAQIVARVGTFDFGAKDVPAMTILYPIDFLPAL